METVVSRSADEQEWTIYSCDPVVMRKLERLFGCGSKKGESGRVWRVPKNGVSFRKPQKRRALTHEERKRLADQLAKTRKN